MANGQLFGTTGRRTRPPPTPQVFNLGAAFRKVGTADTGEVNLTQLQESHAQALADLEAEFEPQFAALREAPVALPEAVEAPRRRVPADTFRAAGDVPDFAGGGPGDFADPSEGSFATFGQAAKGVTGFISGASKGAVFGLPGAIIGAGIGGLSGVTGHPAFSAQPTIEAGIDVPGQTGGLFAKGGPVQDFLAGRPHEIPTLVEGPAPSGGGEEAVTDISGVPVSSASGGFVLAGGQQADDEVAIPGFNTPDEIGDPPGGSDGFGFGEMGDPPPGGFGGGDDPGSFAIGGISDAEAEAFGFGEGGPGGF